MSQENSKESEVQYVVRDKPAERGLTINNILLSLIILGGGIFSWVAESYISHLINSVNNVEVSISAIREANGVTANELGHINATLLECKKSHIILEKRVYTMETIVYREHPREVFK